MNGIQNGVNISKNAHLTLKPDGTRLHIIECVLPTSH